MNIRPFTKLCLTILSLFISGSLFARNIVQVEPPTFQMPTAQENEAGNNVIFSNLGDATLGKFATSAFDGVVVAGKRALGDTETWSAVSFVPEADVQATVLFAAIEYLSGTKLVTLGIYNDDGNGTVGTLLPGGEGSTTQIPESGTCCQMAKVTLPAAGVSLKANTQYWLVAGPDNVNGADFDGRWQVTTKATDEAYSFGGWSSHFGPWPAARIMGRSTGQDRIAESVSEHPSQSTRDTVIFNDLGPRAVYPPYAAGGGLYVAGDQAAIGIELWQAVPFTPKVATHAITLAAAIGYQSGAKKVNLGIYSDNEGLVGTLLPGGQGSTTDIPTLGVCCDLARVTLTGQGVALTAGTQYWLVASPDDVAAPTFQGLWQMSYRAAAAYQEPEVVINWTSFSGLWLAAQIRGTTR
jgi:hypothetical protein